MHTEYTQNLKTDKFGDVDIAYYVAKGREARSAALAEILLRFMARFRSGQSKTRALPLNVNFRH